eukprot:gene11686-13800_t
MGEFNNWEPSQYPGTCDDFGVWRVFIPDQEDGTPTVPHMSQVRVSMETPEGRVDRVPTWAQYVERCEGTDYHNGVFYNPPENERYQWQHDKPNRKRSLRIYEAHVGMSSEDHGVATYNHFTDNVLPRIKEGGYNAIQLMAVQEHALYSSFGYQVTSFFAASSRSGTPEDLKRLVDTAHGLGLTVLLDVVHAHASSNTMDGLNLFDTSTGLYFRDGPSGYHDLWGTRMFDYGNYEVMRFLLSNLRWPLWRLIVDLGDSLWILATHCGSWRLIVDLGDSLWILATHCGSWWLIVDLGDSLWILATRCGSWRLIVDL